MREKFVISLTRTFVLEAASRKDAEDAIKRERRFVGDKSLLDCAKSDLDVEIGNLTVDIADWSVSPDGSIVTAEEADAQREQQRLDREVLTMLDTIKTATTYARANDAKHQQKRETLIGLESAGYVKVHRSSIGEIGEKERWEITDRGRERAKAMRES